MKMNWKIYFYLILTLVVIDFTLRLIVSSWLMSGLYFSATNQIELILYSTVILGLYGFVFKKKIFHKFFWAILFVIVIAYDCWDLYDYFTREIVELGIETSFWGYIVDGAIFLLALPIYFALYLYSFRSNELWEGFVTTTNEQ